MDLRTQYMGMTVRGPFLAGASPLADDLDACRRLEDAGASALVMHSLFEEQIVREERSLHHHTTAFELAHPEASSYFPEPERFSLGPDSYLEQIRRLKEALSIPVIASLNGTTLGGWTHYARLMQEAGADGIELNVYHLALDPDESPREVERRYTDILRAVKAEVRLPVAMKLSPFFSAPVYTARQLDLAGADALVLFNRFYQPDIDIDTLEVVPIVRLSDSSELLLRLRWLAAISGLVRASLAVTGGVHTFEDAVKALMAGAHAVQMTSALLRHGPEVIAKLERELRAWLVQKEYASLAQLIGSMSLVRCPEPASFARANYMKVLQSWDLTR